MSWEECCRMSERLEFVALAKADRANVRELCRSDQEQIVPTSSAGSYRIESLVPRRIRIYEDEMRGIATHPSDA